MNTIRIWHSATGFKTVSVADIHTDDTIGVARAKIAHSQGVPVAHVHMWASVKISKSWQYVTSVASSVVSSSWDDTLSLLRQVFDVPFDKPNGPVTLHSIVRLIFDSDANSAFIPLGYSWRYNTDIVFHPNPYVDPRVDPRFLNSSIVLATHESTVLESYHFASKTINACILRGELDRDGDAWRLGFIRKFFPQLPISSDYTRADAQLRELQNRPVQTWTQLGPRIVYMQVSANINDNTSSYDLLHIFNTVETSKKIPACSYSGKFFKVSRKQYGAVQNSMVDHEVKRNAKDPPRGTYVKWYYFIDRSSCLVFTLQPNLQYMIELKSNGQFTTAAATTALRGMQHIIDHCRAHLPIDAYLPEVEDVWKAQRLGSTTRVNRIIFRTEFFATHHVTPSAAAFAKEIEKLDALMHVTGIQGDSVMLQYTRVSDYIQLSPIQYFAVMHLYRPRPVLVRMIREKFDVDSQVASDAISYAISVSQKRDRNAIRDTLATAVVQCKQIFIKVDVKCRDIAVADRIIAIIKAAAVPQQKDVKIDVSDVEEEESSDFHDLFFDDDDDISDFEEEVAMDATRNDRYILDMLTHADPELFGYHVPGYVSYATQCGKVDARQPVTFTPAEMAKQNETNPSGYGTAVQHSSSPDIQNYYACPDVWCPKSKIAYRHDQFKKCPFPNEEPLKFESKYWKGLRKDGHIGFLKPAKHPQGLCMPCCFSIPKRQFDTCLHSSTSDVNTYVKASQVTLDENRLSLLPDALVGLLHNTKCGARHDGSGTLLPNKSCFVRVGSRVDITFVELLADRLQLGKVDQVKRTLADVTEAEFVSLQAGAIARSYIQKAAATRADLASARELYIADVIGNASFPLVIDNFSIKYDISILVIELRPSLDHSEDIEAFVYCASQMPRPESVIVLWWPGNRFDIVAKATVTSELQLEFKLTDSHLHKMMQAFVQKRPDPVLRILETFNVTRWVLDPVSVDIRGVMIDHDIFIPVPDDIPLPILDSKTDWIFLDKVLQSSAQLSALHVTSIIDSIRQKTRDDRFHVTYRILKQGRVVALQMDDAIVPIDYKELRTLPQAAWFRFGIQSFREISDNIHGDAMRKAYKEALDESEAARTVPSLMLAISCDFQTRQRLRFAGSSLNPFPVSERMADARRVVTEFIANARRNNPGLLAKNASIIPMLIERVVHLFVIGSAGCTFSYRSTQTISHNDVVLTAAQVTTGQTETIEFF